MALITEEVRAKAEMYQGDEICQEKSKFLLQEVGLPRGLLPLRDIIECGYVKETGFVWLKQKQKVEHCFQMIGRKVSYAPDITAYVENSKIKKLSGVKAKELLVWLTIEEIVADDVVPPSAAVAGKLTFKTPAGLFRTFPASAFEIEEEEKDKAKNKPIDEEKKVEKVAAAPPPDQASKVVPNH